MQVEKHEYELFADYHQFYLQDESSDEDTSDIWTEQASADWLAVARFAIHINTARNMNVPVTIEIHDAEPHESFEEWQHITECSFEVASGNIVVAGCTDDFEEAARIKVQPGTYQVRIFYGDLDKLSEDGLDGDDHYKVILWQGSPVEPIVIKSGV